MFTLTMSPHSRDRKFEVILELPQRDGITHVGSHPDCLDQLIMVNLKSAVKEGRPVLSGILQPGKWVDAWDDNGEARGEKEQCLVYSGHVHFSVSDEDAEEALNLLATRLGTALKSPKVRVALADQFWVFTAREISESAA